QKQLQPFPFITHSDIEYTHSPESQKTFVVILNSIHLIQVPWAEPLPFRRNPEAFQPGRVIKHFCIHYHLWSSGHFLSTKLLYRIGRPFAEHKVIITVQCIRPPCPYPPL